jgi:uncharacterized protein (TIRG00374 family)
MTDKLRSRRFKMALNVVTILALIGLAYALRRQLADTFNNLQNVNFYWLLLMIPLQILNYNWQGKLYQGLFRVLGERFRIRSMVRMAIELNFINTIFPSGGVSGFSYIALRLKDEGISTAKASFVQLMKFILIFISFQILLFVGLVALAIGGKANDFAILVAGMLATLILVGTLLLAYVVGSKSRINTFFTVVTQSINWLIHIFRPKHPETISIERAKVAVTEVHENYMMIRRDLVALKWPLLYALLASLKEVLTIYVVYIAFGEWVNIGAVIIAYAVANFAGLVSILPGGIGIYEALMTAVLTAGGIPAALSLPVTVMYRVLSMGLQLPVGYYFYHRALHDKPALVHFEQELPEESVQHERK